MNRTLIRPVRNLADYAWPVEDLRNAPGLGRNDRAILAAHLDRGLWKPQRAYAYVPVGPIPQPDANTTDPDPLRAVAETYARRIDLVVWIDDHPYVVEIKPAAAYVAFGQAVHYTREARFEYPELANAYPAVLTDTADPAICPTCHSFAVTIWALNEWPYTPTGYPT
jgi:hypothetical protein